MIIEIIDIHEQDAYHDDKDVLIGKQLVCDNNITLNHEILEWSSCHDLPFIRPIKLYDEMIDYISFYAFKYKIIQE